MISIIFLVCSSFHQVTREIQTQVMAFKENGSSRNHIGLQRSLMKENGARIVHSQDRRSSLLLIALIDLMYAGDAAPAKCSLVCSVYLLLMRPALAPASDAP